MLMLISPAKSLDYESPLATKKYSQPEFLNDSAELIETVRKLKVTDIQHLMDISPALADLNFGRFLNWHLPFTPDNARPAILAFKGDVYQGMQADTFSAKDFDFAQQHLRILSGLYGLLRPLDLMQAYRLEMGTALKNPRGNHLYDFWGDQLTQAINTVLARQKNPVLVNLASNEYFKAVKLKQITAPVITPVFKDLKNGQYKMISFYAKKARGLMSAYIIKNKITNVEDIKAFDSEGYYYSAEHSKAKEWVFLRDAPPE
jgi:cytoplasmic iron level regulating protein YaaA (DUF328/UPF0246 family)